VLVSRASMEKEPADSPKIVTLLGLPPKAWMLRWTQSSAKRWSRKPRLRFSSGISGEFANPKAVCLHVRYGR
jgi:hypothetical protein